MAKKILSRNFPVDFRDVPEDQLGRRAHDFTSLPSIVLQVLLLYVVEYTQ